MLKRNRITRSVDSHDFAFQDYLIRLDVALHAFSYFWQAWRCVCESSAENSHFTFGLVDLNSCTIILVFEGGFAAVRFQGFVNVVGYLSQHKFDGSEHLKTDF